MTGFFKDLFSGNFSGVVDDITSAFKKLPAPLQAFIVKAESDEGQLLETLAEQEIVTVVTGGFSTASFVQAGKNIVSAALAQGKTVLMSDAMAQLNILASSNPANPAVVASGADTNSGAGSST